MKIIMENLAIEYRDEGTGPVSLFLHGWQDDLHTFDSLVPYLSPTRRIIRLDLPGFGKSELPRAAWTLNDYARLVRACIEKLNIQIDMLIGHSFGGRIAIKGITAKILQPRALVLIASPGGGKRRTARNAFFKIAARIGGWLLHIPPLVFWREGLRRRLYRGIGSDYASAGALRETFLNIVTENISDSAKQITTPTLLIWGEEDTETPLSDGERLARLIRGSALKKIRGAGHFVHRERPREVARIIQEFLC